MQYVQDYDELFPIGTYDDPVQPWFADPTWAVLVNPYIKNGISKVDFGAGATEIANDGVHRCPSAPEGRWGYCAHELAMPNLRDNPERIPASLGDIKFPADLVVITEIGMDQEYGNTGNSGLFSTDAWLHGGAGAWQPEGLDSGAKFDRDPTAGTDKWPY